MKQSTLMMILTGIIIIIACFGKYVESNITKSATKPFFDCHSLTLVSVIGPKLPSADKPNNV